MIIYKALLPILLFVRSERAEIVNDPCSRFDDDYGNPLVKCWSEKPEEDYLECYDSFYKEEDETNVGLRLMYWCWSRHDNNEDDLKKFAISANGYDYDNAEVNGIINRPFTARLYFNETHITCQENEEWSIPIFDALNVYCPTSTGHYPAYFFKYRNEMEL
jgi:hypothetical protein